IDAAEGNDVEAERVRRGRAPWIPNLLAGGGVDDRRREDGEVALPQRLGRQRQRELARHDASQSLVVEEEEGRLRQLTNRPPEGRAELLELVRRLGDVP